MRRALTSILLLSTAACAGTDDTMTFAEFQQHVSLNPETGTYAVDGDEPVEDLAALQAYYDAYVAPAPDEPDGVGSTQEPLIIDTVNGKDDKWSNATADNITYCVSQSSFGSHYTSVVNALASAASAWHAVADVTFKHVSSKDSACNNATTGVVFNVRAVTGQTYIAMSFFPSWARAKRELLINNTAFPPPSPITLTGVLRHELGHVIGFRHEHIRPEAHAGMLCSTEDNHWRALTVYDSASVMHYPQCNGTNTGDLVLTSLDKAGAKLAYCPSHAIACGGRCCTTAAKLCGTGGQCCDGITCSAGCPC